MNTKNGRKSEWPVAIIVAIAIIVAVFVVVSAVVPPPTPVGAMIVIAVAAPRQPDRITPVTRAGSPSR